MLRNGRVAENLCYNGCSCHNSKNARRHAKHSARQREKKNWLKQEKNDN